MKQFLERQARAGLTLDCAPHMVSVTDAVERCEHVCEQFALDSDARNHLLYGAPTAAVVEHLREESVELPQPAREACK